MLTQQQEHAETSNSAAKTAAKCNKYISAKVANTAANIATDASKNSNKVTKIPTNTAAKSSRVQQNSSNTAV